MGFALRHVIWKNSLGLWEFWTSGRQEKEEEEEEGRVEKKKKGLEKKRETKWRRQERNRNINRKGLRSGSCYIRRWLCSRSGLERKSDWFTSPLSSLIARKRRARNKHNAEECCLASVDVSHIGGVVMKLWDPKSERFAEFPTYSLNRKELNESLHIPHVLDEGFWSTAG